MSHDAPLMNALAAESWCVALGGLPVLGPVSLALPAGRWTAIVGPNGAGKSTLLRSLAGLQAGEGAVRLQDRPLSQWPAKARARTLAWLGQTETGADDLRAEDVVMLGRLPHQAWLASPTETDRTAVREAMQQTHCWDWRCKPMGQLSGGERQRVLLARALAVQAQVLLMDEPLAHLDPPHQADWLGIVQALRDRGVTVVSVLHELNMALHADELVVMAQGRVLHQGPTHAPQAHAALVQVFDGRISLHAVGAQWVALPCAAPAPCAVPIPTSHTASHA
ncbi:ABC transporter ATP-binding protein [Aquabacterium sp.]|jgi:iron complex transport system ATP-binding protein|uniref:ABC transporter ATP-binding protein n=1 Tax=Aquabacterium sp. TaxID=1872578 RepID=UPI0025BE2FF6|nr:ABC transporter ATP-binding protein [Aquabacterium sp.]